MRRLGVVLLGVVLLAGCAGGPADPRASGAPSPGPTTAATSAPESSAPTVSAEVAPAVEPLPELTVVPDPTPTPTPSTPAARRPPPAAGPFAATSGPITPELAARMAPSWRAGCPVPLEDLRYVTLTHRGFGGEVSTGELVVHADAVDAISRAFRTLFEAGYPIRSMRLVDDFGADDDASMAADNTSAFNCRPIAGTSTWSQHSYGRAIDINPVENPYVSRSGVYPSAGAGYASRPDKPGVIHAGDAVVRAFAAVGWGWGGSWSSPTDFQHFSATGG